MSSAKSISKDYSGTDDAAPHLKYEIQLGQADAALHAAVKDVLQQSIASWRKLNPSDIQVSTISGGITNKLLKLSPPEGSSQSSVALRVFGDKTEDLIDRHRELRVLRQLNVAGFGAPVLATFDNGRIEAYIPYHPLEDAQLAVPRNAGAIAARLAQLHAVCITEPRTGEVFNMLHRWLHDARQLRHKTEDDRRRFAEFDLEDMERQVSEVQASCEALQSPIVCSHNDLLAGNILVPDLEGQTDASGELQPAVQFIDFEYSCYMHRGFDWGNHFNEYAGFDCDYAKYPNKGQAEHFLRSYLTEAQGGKPDDEDVRAAVVEANAFALVSHQFWGTWALFQAAHSAIDFDYLSYASLRWDEYRRQRGPRLEAAMQLVAERQGRHLDAPIAA